MNVCDCVSDEQEGSLFYLVTKIFHFQVWTSTRKKARQTAQPFADAGFAVRQHSVLTQINPGEVDGMTLAEIKEHYPEELKRARADPYRHRYPRAEVII